MPYSPEWLKNNWLSILGSLPVEPGEADELFENLIACYGEEHRFYHKLDHLGHVLATAATLQHFAHDFTAVQLAAWFHDAIYDPLARNNEERSAAYAAEALPELGVAPPTIAAVQRLILATKTHQAAADDVDAHVLLDADLAILGAAPDRYDAYARAIRQEYAWVADEQYRHGRRQVLERLLKRDKIYRTLPMAAAYETQARRNLRRELENQF